MGSPSAAASEVGGGGVSGVVSYINGRGAGLEAEVGGADEEWVGVEVIAVVGSEHAVPIRAAARVSNQAVGVARVAVAIRDGSPWRAGVASFGIVPEYAVDEDGQRGVVGGAVENPTAEVSVVSLKRSVGDSGRGVGVENPAARVASAIALKGRVGNGVRRAGVVDPAA
jgi:hypothetical protein